jgi:hypothetical protein
LSDRVDRRGGAAFFVGDGFAKYPAAAPARAQAAEDATGGPRARELLRLGRDRLARGMLDDPRSAAPHYVRASAAEEKR